MHQHAVFEVVAQAAVTDASVRAVLTGLRHTHVDRVAKAIEKLQADGHAVSTLDPRISAAALCAMVEGFARHWMGSDSESEEQMALDARVLTTLTELLARSL